MYKIYRCCVCFAERHYGFGVSLADDEPLPLLNCKTCKKPTRHLFSRTVPDRNETEIAWGDRRMRGFDGRASNL